MAVLGKPQYLFEVPGATVVHVPNRQSESLAHKTPGCSLVAAQRLGYGLRLMQILDWHSAAALQTSPFKIPAWGAPAAPPGLGAALQTLEPCAVARHACD